MSADSETRSEYEAAYAEAKEDGSLDALGTADTGTDTEGDD